MRCAVKCMIVALIFFVIGVRTTQSSASGFYPPEIVFLTIDEQPLLQGELGVIRRYPPSHLFVAYRYLTGRGLDEEERKAVKALWNPMLDDWGEQDKWMNDWLAARSLVMGSEPPTVSGFSRASDTNPYFWYHNCLADTF